MNWMSKIRPYRVDGIPLLFIKTKGPIKPYYRQSERY